MAGNVGPVSRRAQSHRVPSLRAKPPGVRPRGQAPVQPLRVRPTDATTHGRFLAQQPSASFLQTPGWAAVKSDWAVERLGWFDATGQQLGAALVLYRQVPRLRRYLAYIPEGPVLPWDEVVGDLPRWLEPLAARVRGRGAFTLKIGPPVVQRRWEAATVKAAIAAGAAARIGAVEPDIRESTGERLVTALRAAGWRREDGDTAGFGDVQPRYVFWVPLVGRSTDDLLAGLNQEWRRNIRKAEKAGVEVTLGSAGDLAAFHELYLVTARRDGFTGRPLAYFERMLGALGADAPDRVRLYLARHGDDLLAATLWIRVGGHVWYSYGASADHGREVRPSNAIQWRMLTDAQESGAAVYDLRGVSDTLVSDDPLFGLIRFKLGTGGQVVEYVGEWDLPLRPVWAKAFDLYLRRRSR